MRTGCAARRPDVTLEDTLKKTILLNNMACPNKYNKVAIRDGKIEKYHQLSFELQERWDGYILKVISAIIGSLGGGIKELKNQTNLWIQ